MAQAEPRRELQIQYKDGDNWSGIIAHLTAAHGGNVHETGTVEVTASSHGNHEPYEVCNYAKRSDWHTGNWATSWIQFNFKLRSIAIAYYVLRSRPQPTHAPRQWVLEVSNNECQWVTIDERDLTQTQELDGSSVTMGFECNHRNDGFYRFVRLRQTGPNSSDQNHLVLSRIEFFGRLLE
jgi:hypothetical protein